MNNKLKHSGKNVEEPKDRMRYVGMTCAVAVAAATLAIYRFHDTNTSLYKKQIDELSQTVTSERNRAERAEKGLKDAKYVLGDGKCEFAKGEPQGRVVKKMIAEGTEQEVPSDCGLVGDGIYQRDNEGNKESLSYSEIDRLCQESEKPEKPRFAFVDAPEFGTKPIRIRTVAAVIFTKDEKVKNSTNALGEPGVRDTYNPNGDNRTIETAVMTHEVWCPNMYGGKKKETVKAEPQKTEPGTKEPEETEPHSKCESKDVVTNDARSQLVLQNQGNFTEEVKVGPVSLSESVSVSPTGVPLTWGPVVANGKPTSFTTNFNGVQFNPPKPGTNPCTVTVTGVIRQQH